MPPQLSLRLQNVNPDDEAEMTELVRQRRLCGWGEETIPTWRELIRKGDRVSVGLYARWNAHCTPAPHS